jgi:hypothetical protein
MQEKNAPKRFRELVDRAVRELKPYLDDPTEERRERFRCLFRAVEAQRNEQEKIRGWMVRSRRSPV